MLRRSLLRWCATINSAGVQSSAASSPTSTSSQPATPPPVSSSSPSSSWMTGAVWASMGEEFRSVSAEKFLLPKPDTFLSPRATTDVQPAEELLSKFVAENEERYRDVDVRDPKSLAGYEDGQARPKWLTLGAQVTAVSEMISGHLCHQVTIPEWQALFDLKYVEMDLTYWLYVLHVHMIARRATSVPIRTWNRRREVLEEVLLTMFDSWAYTSEDIMGRPPLQKIRNYIKDMYYVTAVNFEEALLHDGAGGDLMLMGFLMKFCPLPRPEDVPMYTYFTLVHYVRFHVALLDRIPDESIAKGNFNFLPPNHPAIFEPYNAVALDEVIRGWTTTTESFWDPQQHQGGSSNNERSESRSTADVGQQETK